MNRVRTIFTEPFWSIILPITSFIFLIPITLRSPIYQVNSGSKQIFSELFSIFLENSKSEYIISALCISAISFMLNRLINAHNLIIKVSHLPSLITSLIGSVLVVNFGWSSGYLALVAFLLGLMAALNLKREGRSEHVLFNTGLFLFLAVIIEPIFILMLPVVLIAFYLIRNISIRELLVFVSSSIVWIVILFSISFLSNGEVLKLESLVDVFNSISVQSSPTKWEVIPFIYSLIIGGFGFISTKRILQSITNREKDLFRFLVILISLLTIYCGLDFWLFQKLNSWFYLILFTSFFLSLNFIFLRGKWLKITHFFCFLCFFSLVCNLFLI